MVEIDFSKSNSILKVFKDKLIGLNPVKINNAKTGIETQDLMNIIKTRVEKLGNLIFSFETEFIKDLNSNDFKDYVNDIHSYDRYLGYSWEVKPDKTTINHKLFVFQRIIGSESDIVEFEKMNQEDFLRIFDFFLRLNISLRELKTKRNTVKEDILKSYDPSYIKILKEKNFAYPLSAFYKPQKDINIVDFEFPKNFGDVVESQKNINEHIFNFDTEDHEKETNITHPKKYNYKKNQYNTNSRVESMDNEIDNLFDFETN